MLPTVLGIGALFSSAEYLYDVIIVAGDGSAKLSNGIGATRSTILTTSQSKTGSSSSEVMSLL